MKNFHPEELSFTDERDCASKESTAGPATKKAKSVIGPEATQLSLSSSYESRTKKVERSKVESLQKALVSTICHTPCAMYTVMNPATRQFIANILRVPEEEIKMPSYTSVTRAVHKNVRAESEAYMSELLTKIGIQSIPINNESNGDVNVR